MLPLRLNFLRPSGSLPAQALRENPRPAPARAKRNRAVTLVEVMCSLFILALFMLGFLSTMMQSRRFTEASVLQSAATSMVYGLIEQLKGLDYTTQIPAFNPLPSPNGTYYVLLRQDQDSDFTIPVRYTPVSTTIAPRAPTVCPAVGVAPADAGASPGAVDYTTPSITMSTVTGSKSQKLILQIWIWIDEIPDTSKDVSDVKRITLVYTYTFNDGSSTKTVRDMEVFLRTNYDL